MFIVVSSRLSIWTLGLHSDPVKAFSKTVDTPSCLTRRNKDEDECPFCGRHYIRAILRQEVKENCDLGIRSKVRVHVSVNPTQHVTLTLTLTLDLNPNPNPR